MLTFYFHSLIDISLIFYFRLKDINSSRTEPQSINRIYGAARYLVVIAGMPLNLAVFGVNTANDVIASYPQVNSWVIGGHSLGGTMAAQFAYENPSKIRELVLWAAYPASGADLSENTLSVTTIRGTNDGLVSSKQIDDSLELLPPSTVRVEIAGGNHAQFGWYGDQGGDNPATITRELQQTHP